MKNKEHFIDNIMLVCVSAVLLALSVLNVPSTPMVSGVLLIPALLFGGYATLCFISRWSQYGNVYRIFIVMIFMFFLLECFLAAETVYELFNTFLRT